jgi:hypothetical protein
MENPFTFYYIPVRSLLIVQQENVKTRTPTVPNLNNFKNSGIALHSYNKTCLKWNLKGAEHFSTEASFPFNQGTL